MAILTPMLALVLAAQTAEPAHPLSYGVEVILRSAHADRGFIIAERPAIQPVAWASKGVAEFWVWANLPLAANTDGSLPQIVEMELTLAPEWGRLTIAPAVRMWIYHDPVSPYSTRSLEGWLHLSYDVGPFRLFTKQSFDVLTYQGAYFGSAGIELEREMSERVSAGGSFGGGWASAKFNDSYAGVARSAFNRVFVEGWLTAYLSPHVYVGPVFEYSKTFDPRIRAALARPTFLSIGLTTGLEF